MPIGSQVGASIANLEPIYKHLPAISDDLHQSGFVCCQLTTSPRWRGPVDVTPADGVAVWAWECCDCFLDPLRVRRVAGLADLGRVPLECV